MSSEDPIPRDLQEAFKEVVYRYAQSEWTPDGPELLVSIDFIPATVKFVPSQSQCGADNVRPCAAAVLRNVHCEFSRAAGRPP